MQTRREDSGLDLGTSGGGRPDMGEIYADEVGDGFHRLVVISPVGVEKVPLPQNNQNWGDGKCLGKLRKSFVGLPDAILFLRILQERVFQHPDYVSYLGTAHCSEKSGDARLLGRGLFLVASAVAKIRSEHQLVLSATKQGPQGTYHPANQDGDYRQQHNHNGGSGIRMLGGEPGEEYGQGVLTETQSDIRNGFR